MSKNKGFCMVPVELFSERYNTLSTGAFKLYVYFLNGNNLSIKKNLQYIYCTIDTIMKVLNCSRPTATNVLAELETAGLIMLDKAKGKRTKIHVVSILSENNRLTTSRNCSDFKSDSSYSYEDLNDIINSDL